MLPLRREGRWRLQHTELFRRSRALALRLRLPRFAKQAFSHLPILTCHFRLNQALRALITEQRDEQAVEKWPILDHVKGLRKCKQCRVGADFELGRKFHRLDVQICESTLDDWQEDVVKQCIGEQVPRAIVLNLKRLLGVFEYVLDLFDEVQDTVELQFSALGRLVLGLFSAKGGEEVAEDAGLSLVVSTGLLLACAERNLLVRVDDLVKRTNLRAEETGLVDEGEAVGNVGQDAFVQLLVVKFVDCQIDDPYSVAYHRLGMVGEFLRAE